MAGKFSIAKSAKALTLMSGLFRDFTRCPIPCSTSIVKEENIYSAISILVLIFTIYMHTFGNLAANYLFLWSGMYNTLKMEDIILTKN